MNSNDKIPFHRAVAAMVWKDLTLERHTRQTLSLMFLYALTVTIMFNFALETKLDAARNVATGLLWATIVLSGTLGLNRAMSLDRENNSLDAILMAPIDRQAIYVAKVLSITLFTLTIEAILVFVFIVFFNKPFWRPSVILILILGTIGYISVGVLVTALTYHTRGRDVLLPVLLLPLSLPLLLPASMAVAGFVSTPPATWTEVQTAVSLVILYDIVMITLGLTTYRYTIEV
ncbi:MAG TPA: heme exporter protein CcmB [Anaerolineae bacterium]|nr:heme exporter protein CcmB [Anaerolineae bacterium]